jgi:hypothetical protein
VALAVSQGGYVLDGASNRFEGAGPIYSRIPRSVSSTLGVAPVDAASATARFWALTSRGVSVRDRELV